MDEAPAATILDAEYFDGRSGRARPVRLRIEQQHLIVHELDLDAVERRYPLRQVQWPERTRHGQRQAQLPDGGLVSARAPGEWDAWLASAARGHDLGGGLAARWFSSWRRSLIAVAVVVALGGATWHWGVPVAGDQVARLLPASMEQSIGDESMSQLDDAFLKPSELSAEQQGLWRERFAAMVASQPGEATTYRLHFRNTGTALGPNAFALPGGHIVVTDELIKLLGDQPDAVLGVLAHELGHVRERHGMRLAMRASLSGALVGFAIGDFSSLLAAGPAALMNASYSRDFERAADAQAKRLLIDSGRSPRAMLTLFERIDTWRATRAEQAKVKAEADRASAPRRIDKEIGDQAKTGAGELLRIAFNSHPADEERIRFFEQ